MLFKKFKTNSVNTFSNYFSLLCSVLIYFLIIFLLNCLNLTLNTFTFMGMPPAYAASICGQVVSELANPLQDMTVMVMDVSSGFHYSICTNTLGEYQFDGLDPGQYVGWVNPVDSGYITEFYDDAPNINLADTIQLEEGQIVTGINFILSIGRAISGRITREDTGEPIADVRIGALSLEYQTSGFYPGFTDYPDEMYYSGKTMGRAFTDINGNYTIYGLSPGKYQVGLLFMPESIYAPKWYEDEDDPSTATYISLGPDTDITGIDFCLGQAGLISGRLTDQTGDPVEELSIRVIPLVADSSYPMIYSDYSDPNGRYAIGGLKPGKYTLEAGTNTLSGVNYHPQKTIITIQAGQVIDQVNFILQKEGEGIVSGKVTDAIDGKPLKGISISILPTNSYYYYGSIPIVTDPNGLYSFSGLGEGEFIIQANPQPYLFGSDLSKYILNLYYDGVYDYNSADSIHLPAQGQINNIDFSLMTGGSISGRITNSSDQSPIAGAYVRASVCVNMYPYGAYGPYIIQPNILGISSGLSDSEGKYILKGLATGNYKIIVENAGFGYPASSQQRKLYLPGSYHDMECIKIIAPYENPNINISLNIGANISGQIKDTDTGNPLSGIQILAKVIEPETYPEEDKFFSGIFPEEEYISNSVPIAADTDMLGNYNLVGLPAGEYQIIACDKRKLYSCSPYKIVRVEEGQGISNINCFLKLGRTISGTITDDATGLPVAGIKVMAVDMNYNLWDFYDSSYYQSSYEDTSSAINFLNTAFTDQTGNYIITGLEFGTYRVIAGGPEVDDPYKDANCFYLSETYNNIPLYNYDYTYYTELSKELNLSLDDSKLLFGVRGDAQFQLILELRTQNDELIVLKCESEGQLKEVDVNTYMEADGTIVFPLEKIGNWEEYEVEINKILGYFDLEANFLDKIILKGNSYWIEYITLIDEENKLKIDTFAYSGNLPAGSGWVNIYPQTTYLAKEQNNGSGDGVLRVACGQAVVLTQSGSIVNDCDFALAKAGSIAGKIFDEGATTAVEGIGVSVYDYSTGSLVTSAVSDQQGNYKISGLGPDDYFLLAQDPQLNYLDQYYNQVENPYTGFVIDQDTRDSDNFGYHHYRSVLTKNINFSSPDLLGVSFILKTNGPYCLSFTMGTTEGKTVRIDKTSSEGQAVLGFDDIIQIPITGQKDSEFMPGTWQNYRINFNSIMSSQINSLQKITIKGDDYCLGYIDLMAADGYYVEDIRIEEFDYNSPINHGWVNYGEATSQIDTIIDPQTGSRVLRVLPYGLVTLSMGQTIENKNFPLAKASCFCGKVMDDTNNPIPGIEITAHAQGRNLSYYAISEESVGGYYYGDYGGGNYGRPNTSKAITDNQGEYCLKGLYPGEYYLLAKDGRNYYNGCFYKNIPTKSTYQRYYSTPRPTVFNLPNQSYTSLYQDISDRAFDNPTCSFQSICNKGMEVYVETETDIGSSVTFILSRDFNILDQSITLDPNIYIIVPIDYGYSYGYSGSYGYTSGSKWVKAEKNLNSYLNSHTHQVGSSVQLIKGVRISGNDYRVDFIKFTENGQPDQVVDEFNYAEANDLPTDHGWINELPETTSMAMIKDETLEKKVLAVTAFAPLEVGRSEVKNGVDFHLTAGVRIEGAIIESETGTPIAGIYIIAGKDNSPPTSYGDGYYGSSSEEFSAVSDASGHYTLFIPCYEGELKEYTLWAKDYSDIYGDAQYDHPLQVTAGSVLTGINFSMGMACSISGRVVSDSDGQPIANMRVQARVAVLCYLYCLSDENSADSGCACAKYEYDPYIIVKYAYTNQNGEYTLRNLSPGGYIICTSSSYNKDVTGFYDDNSDYQDPSVILESGQKLTSIDIQSTLWYYAYSSPFFSPFTYGGDGSDESSGAYSGSSQSSQDYFSGLTASNSPVITSNPMNTAIVDEDFTYQITILDPNSYQEDPVFQLSTAPEGMQIDTDTGLITCTPNSTQIGLHKVQVGVNSDTRGIARQEFILEVIDYKFLGTCNDGNVNPGWIVESGNGNLQCVYDEVLKTEVLEAETVEADSLNFMVGFGEITPQVTKRYFSVALVDENSFRIKVEVRASSADYSIIYSPTDGQVTYDGTTIYQYLGNLYQDGTWHIINRDLQAELDPLGVTFEYIRYFHFQGDYRIHDLKIGISPFEDELVCLNLVPGLNVVGITKDMMKRYNTSGDLMEYFGGDHIAGMKKYNTYLKSWEAKNPSSIVGFTLKDYHGYCIYAKDNIAVAFKSKRSGFQLQEIAKRLKPGINLIHLYNLPRQQYRASELIKELNDLLDTKVISIQKYQPYAGQWKGAYRFFNNPTKLNFELKVGEGYLVHVK